MKGNEGLLYLYSAIGIKKALEDNIQNRKNKLEKCLFYCLTSNLHTIRKECVLVRSTV